MLLSTDDSSVYWKCVSNVCNSHDLVHIIIRSCVDRSVRNENALLSTEDIPECSKNVSLSITVDSVFNLLQFAWSCSFYYMTQ